MGHHEELLKDQEFRKEFAGMLNPDGSITLDRSRAYPIWSDVCCRCARLVSSGFRRCHAFGDQTIPDDIWFGRNDHSAPVPGDNGMVFMKLVRP